MTKISRGDGELIVAGMGLRPEHMSIETMLELKRCRRIYTSVHGGYVEEFLRTLSDDIRFINEGSAGPGIVKQILGALSRGERIAYLTAGNPMLFSGFAQQLAERCGLRGIACKVLPAVSSLDALLCGVAPSEGAWNGFSVIYGPFLDQELERWNPDVPVFVFGVSSLCEKSSSAIRRAAGAIASKYPPGHPIRFVEYRVGNEGDAIRESRAEHLERELLTIKNLMRAKKRDYMGTLYFPPSRSRPAPRVC